MVGVIVKCESCGGPVEEVMSLPFGVPDAPTRPGDTARGDARYPGFRTVLGFYVHDGSGLPRAPGGGLSWITTRPYKCGAIPGVPICNVRGAEFGCGVIVTTRDVERACLDLLRAGVRSTRAGGGA